MKDTPMSAYICIALYMLVMIFLVGYKMNQNPLPLEPGIDYESQMKKSDFLFTNYG